MSHRLNINSANNSASPLIAIIPARGGSKGLPGKNIRPLHEKPLIAYTIEAAQKSKYLDHIIISTDDQDIADVAASFGAKIPFMRPAELAQDDSLAIDAYLYTINQLEKPEYLNTRIENVVILQPTSPLRDQHDIDAAIELFWKKQADSVISFYESPHPHSWHKYIDNQGVLRSSPPQPTTTTQAVNATSEPHHIYPSEPAPLRNRQEELKTYLPNGAVMVIQTAVLRKQRTYYTDQTYPYLMPAWKSVDIDTADDFALAEFWMQRSQHQMQSEQHQPPTEPRAKSPSCPAPINR